MAQDRDSEQRLMAMGVVTAPLANLKTVGAPLNVDETALSALDALIGERRVLLAASTHYGEDALIAHALEAYVRDGDLLILVPRHPLKAGDIRIDIEALGLHVAQRSLKEPVTAATQVYLADTLGELGLFFGLADIIVMGGSFQSGVGGHNPLEPARLGKSVITGPDVFNWQGIFDFADRGRRRLQGRQRVGSQLPGRRVAIQPRSHRRRRPRRARGQPGEAGTLDRVWSALSPLLPERSLVKTPQWWYRRHAEGAPWWRFTLWPLSLLWRIIVNNFKRHNARPYRSTNTYVISVGNATLGGSGKTPIAGGKSCVCCDGLPEGHCGRRPLSPRLRRHDRGPGQG